jgi:glycerophosphoryl diester phosphodiesterase
VTPKLLDIAHESGLQVHTWTVNDPAEMAKFRGIGVDGIFTDFPERASSSGGL